MLDNDNTTNDTLTEDNSTEDKVVKGDKKRKRGKIEFLDNIQINLVATIIFVLFYFFIGAHNYSVKQKLIEERSTLHHEIDSINHQITKDSILIKELKNSDEALEKYVREMFYMHRTGEEVYIIEARP